MEKTYRDRIRELREDNDLTQQQVAQILHTRYNVYQRYELGTSKMPIHHLTTLAKYYHVPTDYILVLTDTQTPYPPSKYSQPLKKNP